MRKFFEIIDNERNFNFNELNRLILNFAKIMHQINYSVNSLYDNILSYKKLQYQNFNFFEFNNFENLLSNEKQIELVNLARVEIYFNKKLQM